MKVDDECNRDGIPLEYLHKMKKSKATNKASYFAFAESDERMRLALLFRDRWLECFFIQSMVWAFGSLLKDDLKKKLLKHLYKKVMRNLRAPFTAPQRAPS